MKRSLFLIFVMVFLLSTSIYGISLDIAVPTYIVQGENIAGIISIDTDQGFDGTLYIGYNNIDSGISSINFQTGNFIGGYYNYTWPVQGVSEGAYTIFGNLTNSTGDTLATFIEMGIVNSTMPKVISSSPTGTINKDEALLSVRTNEEATCKYSKSEGNYDNMTNTFTYTGDYLHNISLSSLSQGEHKFYVRCKDRDGYKMNQSEIVRFEVDLAPTAKIELSDESPVKQGTIEIKLTTSKGLIDTPTLQYSYDGSETKDKISLTGSGSEWTGYIIITDLDDGKVGSFYFTGVDSGGNIGRTITSGNLFLVDTTKPPAPQSLKAITRYDGSVRLNWHYDDEEVDYFNVYRSTSSGINYVDLFSETNSSDKVYVDSSTIDKVTYYYRVSAVDLAGNEGPLSVEVYSTSVSEIPKETVPEKKTVVKNEVPKLLPPDLIPKVDEQIGKIDKIILDVKEVTTRLDGNENKKQLIEELELDALFGSANAALDKLKQRLVGFKQSYATESELQAKINEIDMESKKIQKSTPKDVNILEKADFIQSTGKEDIEIAVKELFNNLDLSEKQKNDYIKLNNKKRDKVNVEINSKIVKIDYLDGGEKVKSFINKRLSYKDPETLEDVLVIEFIPKSIAENVNEIDFLDKKVEVLAQDPIVKFGFLKFDYNGEEIKYTLDKRINIDDVKNTKSIVLLSLNEIEKEKSSVTGLSVFSLSNLGLSNVNAYFLIIGVTLILLLGGYYVFIKGDSNISHNVRRQFNILRLKQSVGKPNRNYSYGGQKIPAHSSDRESEEILEELTNHFKNAKVEMADKLYPVINALHDKLESKKHDRGNINLELINRLINQAHNHINNNELNKAAGLYPQINFAYQNLPKDIKPALYGKCLELHNKIHGKK